MSRSGYEFTPWCCITAWSRPDPFGLWLGSATVEALLSGGESVMTSRVQAAALSTRQVLTRQYP